MHYRDWYLAPRKVEMSTGTAAALLSLSRDVEDRERAVVLLTEARQLCRQDMLELKEALEAAFPTKTWTLDEHANQEFVPDHNLKHTETYRGELCTKEEDVQIWIEYRNKEILYGVRYYGDPVTRVKEFLAVSIDDVIEGLDEDGLEHTL